jgi:O-antigen/teichoic acid export membrane protein
MAANVGPERCLVIPLETEESEMTERAASPANSSRRADFAVAIGAMAMQILSGLVMIPLTVAYLSPAEITIWSVFLTFQSVNTLMEFGFTPAFSRNFTYVFAGAASLQAKGAPQRAERQGGPALLAAVLVAAQRFYLLLAVLTLVVFGAGGSIYLYVLTHEHLGAPALFDVSGWIQFMVSPNGGAWRAWFILIATMSLSTYFNWQASLLMGADRMRQNYLVLISSRTTQVTLSVIGLMIAPNVTTLVLAYAASILVYRLMNQRFVADIEASVRGIKPPEAEVKQALAAVSHSATRTGWAQVGSFLGNRFNLLSISAFLGVAAASQFSVALQAYSALSTVSFVVVGLLTPAAAAARVRRDDNALREISAFVLTVVLSVFICGSIALMVIGDFLLSFIHSHTTLPAVSILLLMACAGALDLTISASTSLISTGNRVPYLRAVVATGFLVALGIVVAGVMGGNLASFLIIQIVLLGGYSAWRWPLFLAREVGLTLSNIGPSALQGARRLLLGRGQSAMARHVP